MLFADSSLSSCHLERTGPSGQLSSQLWPRCAAWMATKEVGGNILPFPPWKTNGSGATGGSEASAGLGASPEPRRGGGCAPLENRASM